MKRLVLRKWVVYLLVAINTIAILIMGSEVEDLSLYLTTHIISGLVFAFNSIVLLKFGGNYE